MNWKFWKRKQIEEQGSARDDMLKEEIASLQEQLGKLEEQMNKIVRLQFKTGKNTEEKLGELGSSLSLLTKESELVRQYKNREETIANHIIRLIDELDHVSSGLNDTEQKWQTVLTQWTNTSIKSLEEIGIYQLNVLGKAFDPTIAEALQTVEKKELVSPSEVPYEVIQVIQRGYISENGKLIRKARVVTIKEEDE